MSFKNWWRRIRKKMVLKNKHYKRKKEYRTKKPKIQKQLSVTTLYKKRKISSKLNVRDIELIDGLDVKDLKKQYGVRGSKYKILEAMVTDYKRGKLSLPGLSHKSKFHEKYLDKDRLNQILLNYDMAKRKKNEEDIVTLKHNVEKLKKKLNLTASRKRILEQMLNDLKKANRSDIDIIKAHLNPKIIDQDKIYNLITQYEAGQKRNRGISFLFTKSKLSILASKRKFSALMNEIRNVDLSEYLSKH